MTNTVAFLLTLSFVTRKTCDGRYKTTFLKRRTYRELSWSVVSLYKSFGVWSIVRVRLSPIRPCSVPTQTGLAFKKHFKAYLHVRLILHQAWGLYYKNITDP
jgi:hypothetical protein